MPAIRASMGDSDSTGSIAGNILGAIHGYSVIPAQWIQELELRDAIESLCRDWNSLFAHGQRADVGDETWSTRYPGW